MRPNKKRSAFSKADLDAASGDSMQVQNSRMGSPKLLPPYSLSLSLLLRSNPIWSISEKAFQLNTDRFLTNTHCGAHKITFATPIDAASPHIRLRVHKLGTTFKVNHGINRDARKLSLKAPQSLLEPLCYTYALHNMKFESPDRTEKLQLTMYGPKPSNR